MTDALPAVIQTDRLELRVPDEADADQMAALMTPGVSRWLASWPSPVSPAEVQWNYYVTG